MSCMPISQGVGMPVPADAALMPGTSATAAATRVIADRSPALLDPHRSFQSSYDVTGSGRESIGERLERAQKAAPGLRHHL